MEAGECFSEVFFLYAQSIGGALHNVRFPLRFCEGEEQMGLGSGNPARESASARRSQPRPGLPHGYVGVTQRDLALCCMRGVSACRKRETAMGAVQGRRPLGAPHRGAVGPGMIIGTDRC